jgi:hypothetical protein
MIKLHKLYLMGLQANKGVQESITCLNLCISLTPKE